LTPRERARAAAIASELKRRRPGLAALETADWRRWLLHFFPTYVSAGFAPRHEDFWEWVWAVAPDVRPAPFVALWPRGGAKSTSAELAAVAVGMRRIRRYALYVSETQDQADKHVATIAGLLESAGVDRAVNKYGNSKGWRRNRLRTADGFTVDALGLDTAARGIKVDADRPGLIILDDIDGRHDTPAATTKKIDTITTTILPAGSTDCAVLAVQNLIFANSIFDKLAQGEADFLHDRIVSGPFPALDGFEYELVDGTYRITAGVPTWAGQDVAACQGFVNTWGLRAFLRECQHAIGDAVGALWNRALLDAGRETAPPSIVRIVVAVDPEATSGEHSAETGIIVAGVGTDGHGYVLDDASLRASPKGWASAVVSSYNKWEADRLVAEDNNGGEMVEATIETVPGAPPVTRIHASRNKQARAEPIAALYEAGRIHHVGTFPDLEDQLCSWVPNQGQPSPDRLDALVWAMTELNLVLPQMTGAAAKYSPTAPSRIVRQAPAAGRFGRGETRGWRRR
jgi:hypothetical protein